MTQSNNDNPFFDKLPSEERFRIIEQEIQMLFEDEWRRDLDRWTATQHLILLVALLFPEEEQYKEGVEGRTIGAFARLAKCTMKLVPEECCTGYFMPDPS